jgi:hypothetical protein
MRWVALLLVTLLFSSASMASSLAETQTLQISTNLTEIIGKPSWTLIVRDLKSGLVSPYIFEIEKHNNYWVAFTYGHVYKVQASSLTFGPFAHISNFCGLQNGVLTGISMFMIITGKLTPDPKTYHCKITKYSDPNFTIANPEFR